MHLILLADVTVRFQVSDHSQLSDFTTVIFRNSDIFTCEDNMLFSCVKISCFRAKAHLVFHWCLYNKVLNAPIKFEKIVMVIYD